MDKISVIVPIYNADKYLSRCIDSILMQSYKNIEIILVNDGSTDKCKDICEEYINKDDRIVFIDKENSGVSDARNKGIEIATGKYVMFVDADDILTKNACEILYNEIENKNADYITSNYINMTQDGILYDKPILDINKYTNCKLTFENKYVSSILMTCIVANKIFRLSFLNENNIRFEKGMIAEDSIFSNLCFIKSKNVYYINDVIYCYRQRNVDKKSISTDCSLNYFNNISKSYKLIYENFRINNRLDYYKLFYAKTLTYIMYKFIDATNLIYEEKKEVLNELGWFFELSKKLKIYPYNETLLLLLEHILNEEIDLAIDYSVRLAKLRMNIDFDTKDKMLQIDIINKFNKESILNVQDNTYDSNI